MAKGFMGKLLFINLKDRNCWEEELEEQVYRDYIGGYGLGARILYERLRPRVDPLGKENILGFLAGLFVGTRAYSAGRFNVVAKSPLTGGWGDSSCGGKFGPRIKAAGYDGIFFLDISPETVYVSVFDGAVKFYDAAHLRGHDAIEAEKAIKAELGRGYEVAVIGQGGENLSAIAGIFHDGGRAAARMGLGGVMGSKRLKALACGGTHKVAIADEQNYRYVLDDLKRQQTAERNGMNMRMRENGTGGVYFSNVMINDAPVKNFKRSREGIYSPEEAAKLSSAEFNKLKVRNYTCAQCPVGCGAILETVDDKGEAYRTHRPEYETISCFGSLNLMSDLEDAIEANEACNRYGIDTISAGGTIAWLLECVEEGLLSEAETEGLDLRWGNSEIMVPLIKKMALREGFLGKLLGDGSKAAAAKLGRGSKRYLTDAGGVELAMHDPRKWPGFGYGYYLDPTPGHHCQGAIGFMEHGWKDRELYERYDFSDLPSTRYNYDSKGYPLRILNGWYHFFNGTGICILGKYCQSRYPVMDMVRALTGWNDIYLDEAIKTGTRINTIRHMFNLREGISYKDFALKPRCIGEPPLEHGSTAGVTLQMENVRKDYYKELGWDVETGMPSDAALTDLGALEFCKAYFR